MRTVKYSSKRWHDMTDVEKAEELFKMDLNSKIKEMNKKKKEVNESTSGERQTTTRDE